MSLKDEMLHYIFANNHIVLMLRVFLTVIITLVLIKLSNKFFNKLFKSFYAKSDDWNFEKQLKTMELVLKSSIDMVIVILALLHILDIFGIDIKPILAAAGVLGIAVGFGAQKLIEDIISGIALLLDGQIRVGDVVKIKDITGRVEKLNLRLVVIRDIEGTLHYLRNNTIDIVSNYTKDFSYAIFETAVSYNSNIKVVMDVIKNLGEEFSQKEEYKDLITDKLEMLGLDEFSDSAIIIKYRIKTTPSMQWCVYRGFNLALKERFDELNIEIPFPQLAVTQVK